MTPWSLSYKIEAPSRCYPTLPLLILRQVPMGMHTLIPTLMIKTSKKDMEGRDLPVLWQTYVHVLMCGAPPSQRSQHKDRNENTMQRKHPIESNIGRTDSTWIPKANKTIHHENTQPTSIWEHGFYTNLNDVTRPKVMNSLHWPQSESMDSTQILVSMKQQQRSKRNQTTSIKSLNRTQS